MGGSWSRADKKWILSVGRWVLALLVFVAGLAPWVFTRAQMETDGTMGAAQVLAGPNFDIGAALGTQTGDNLFHSFAHFNINTGESATFSGPASIDNVIARVTGGFLSNIDGLLSSTIPGADVFLINPSGLLFGPNASLAVDGSFHASTADQIKFPDGGVFDATNTGATVLSVAEPSAFGFLDSNPAFLLVDRSDLAVPEGASLSLVGGDITVTNADLLAPGGRLELTSLAGPGSVPIEAAVFDTASYDSLGSIGILDDSFVAVVTVSDPGGAAGALFIRGGDLVVDNSEVISLTFGAGDSQDVAIDLSGNLTISDGILTTISLGSGEAADMTIRAGSLTLADGGSIVANAFDSGPGGNLVIAVTGDITLTGRSSTSRSTISSGSFGDSDAGDVTISAATLTITDGARLLKSGFGLGDAGSLTIDVGALTITDGGRIRKDVLGDGRGARVTITASDLITMGRRDPVTGQSSGIYSESATTQDPGSLTIIAPIVEVSEGSNISQAAIGLGSGSDLVMILDRLVVTDGARVSSNTFSFGQSGSITITAREIVLVSGRSDLAGRGSISTETLGPGSGGDIFITSPLIQVQNSALIVADTFADGPAGNINIEVGQLQLSVGGQISSAANLRGPLGVENTGDGGRISIVADDITIVGGLGTDGRIAGIFGSSLTPGTGATIEITADSLTISDGGFIRSGARGSGDGGEIRISLTGDLDISGIGITGQRSAISSITTADGAGGSIAIDARQARISDSALIVADSFGSGNAGEISLTIDGLTLTAGGRISSVAQIAGDAGSITVTAKNVFISGVDSIGRNSAIFGSSFSDGDAARILLEVDDLSLTDGGFIATSTRLGSGAGGSVEITASGLIRIAGVDALGHQSGIFSTVGASGPGGQILITADRIEISENGIVSATTSGSGDSGLIRLSAGNIDVLSGGSVTATTSASGAAGDIAITTTGQVTLDQAFITTESTSTEPDAGTAGDITVAAEELQILNGAQISTQSAFADGGNVDLSLVSLLLLRDSQITTSVGTGTGGGGNITIDSVFVVLDNGTIQANAFGGPGGNITIVSDFFFASPDSLVEASSALGIAGTVVISAPETDLSSGVTELPGTLMDAARRLAKQCNARGGRTLASFVGKGRGALPVQPGAAMMVHYLGDAGSKLGAAPEDGRPTQIAMDAEQPGDARAFLVAGTLQLSCAG